MFLSAVPSTVLRPTSRRWAKPAQTRPPIPALEEVAGVDTRPQPSARRHLNLEGYVGKVSGADERGWVFPHVPL